MKLTAAERQDPLWIKIEKHLQERIESHRATNDGLSLSPEITAAIRGRIAELKDLLKIGQPARDTGRNEDGASPPGWEQ